MPGSRRVFLVSFLAVAVGAIVPGGVAQEIGSHARIVRISYVQGTVQFNGQAAVMNSPVTEESQLVTGSDGLAEVQFEDMSAIRLASETSITFAQLARLSTGEAMTRVDLDGGEAEFLIPASSAGRFAVNVRGKNILFKQPGRFRVLSTNSTPLELALWKGEAGVRDLESGQEVTVRDHETFTLNPADLGQYNLDDSVLADDLDRWSEQRDEALRTEYVTAPSTTIYNTYQYAPSYTSGYAYVPPYVYDYSAFGCPYYGFAGPFWLTSGPCGGGFWFNPWFFSPPVFVVVAPPVFPRRPIPIRPPTVPVVAKGGPATVTGPVYRSFRTQGEGQRVFNDETFQRGPATGVKPGETTPGKVSEATHPPAVGPGQRPAGSTPAPPAHAAPPSRPQHSSPPPSRPPSHSSFSGSHGSSGFSHSSGGAHSSASHSSGRSR